jgi:hypothetical protein
MNNIFKISKLKYSIGEDTYTFLIDPGERLVAVVSSDAMKRQAFISAIQLAVVKRSDKRCGNEVKESSVFLTNGQVRRFPIYSLAQEGNDPCDSQEFFDYICDGKNPFDTILYYSNANYKTTYDDILRNVSGNRLRSIGWRCWLMGHQQKKCCRLAEKDP